MGLDITAYSKLALVEEISFTKLKKGDFAHPLYDDDDHLWMGIVYPAFGAQFDGLKEGFYKRHGESFGFRAGSYGGYNEWRRELATLVGTTVDEVWKGHKPPAFFELINFADNEGTIGPVTSAKLAKDFAEWRDLAVVKFGADEWFMHRYDDWAHAFTLASDGGAVDFH